MSSASPARLLVLTGACAGSGKTTLMRNLQTRFHHARRDVLAVDEDQVWGRRRLDTAPVDLATASPRFRRLHELHLDPVALVATFQELAEEATARGSVWLQDWSWTDLLAIAGSDDTEVRETSRRLLEVAAPLRPRVVHLRVDPEQALTRALTERGDVWFNRYAGTPVDGPVSRAGVRALAARKRSAEPAVLAALAGWPLLDVDASLPRPDLADLVWRELRRDDP